MPPSNEKDSFLELLNNVSMLVSESKTNHSRPVVIVLLRCVIGLKPLSAGFSYIGLTKNGQ